VHVVRIDPKCQGLKIVGSKYEDKGMTTGEFANTYNTDIAINANFSRNDPGNAVLGSVMTDGIAWPSAPDTKDHTMFHCDNENNCNIETMSRISTVPNNTTLIVSGWQVYKNGKFECPINGIVSCHLYNGGNRSPRSIIGMGVDKNIYLFSIE
jgi:exopolysaccharide biosynthesis protein